MRAEIPETSAARLDGVEHPWRVPCRIARRGGSVQAEVDVGEWTEAPLGDEPPRAHNRGLVALGQGNGHEGARGRGFGGNAPHLGGAHAHRLLHEEGIPLVEQVVRDLRHAAMSPEGDDEVRPEAGQHLAVVGEHRRVAERRRPLRRDLGARILKSDQFHVGHLDQMAQIRGIVQRVPVTDLDGRDADSHDRASPSSQASARQCRSLGDRQPTSTRPRAGAGPRCPTASAPSARAGGRHRASGRSH